MNKTKKCWKCKQTKPITEFHKNRTTKDGYKFDCKKCAKELLAEYLKKNPQKHKELMKKWYKKNKQKVIDKSNSYNKLKDNGLFYKYWSMKRRCEYKSQDCWKYYGAKGIVVEWKSYQEFKKDMYRKYKNHIKKYGHRQTTLDRIDSDKNYCKENCRWATYKQQAESIKRNKKKKTCV